MSIKVLKTSTLAALVGLASINTHASSIWLEPAVTLAGVGDSVTLDLYADASDIVYTYIDPIFGEVTEIGFLAGGIDIFYDISVLRYDGFAFNPASGTDPSFTRIADDCSVDPTADGCSGPGEINGLGFGAFDGLAGTTTLLGTFTFAKIAESPSTEITMADNDTPAGPWFGVDGEPAVVDYTGATIQAIPVPAAVWLFGTGLLGLIGVARRRK